MCLSDKIACDMKGSRIRWTATCKHLSKRMDVLEIWRANDEHIHEVAVDKLLKVLLEFHHVSTRG